MAAPTPYELSYDFTAFQASNPTVPLPADKIEIEFNALQTTTDEIIANLAVIQRADNALANNSVGIDQLKTEVSFGLNSAANWVTGTNYVLRDAVYQGNKLYYCIIAHQAGVFATDLAALKWALLLDFDQFVTPAAASAASAAADAVTSGNNAALAAAAAGWKYNYLTATTNSDPASGNLKFNNATLASATALYISETNALSQAIGSVIATWDDSTSTVRGQLRMFKQSDATSYALFNVTGSIVDNGTWDTVTVAYVGGAGTFANTDAVTVQFVRTGDIGATGPTGSTGTGVYTAAAGGAADVLTATLSPVPANLAALTNTCIHVSAFAGTTNATATPTINFNGFGAQTIQKYGPSGAKCNLAVGDIPLIAQYSHDGTNPILLNPATFSKGATVASAGTVNLNTATGNYVQISGTTTITAITLGEGRQAKVKFDGILTLTNGASLILPSGANIITAAGDTAEFVGEASGVVRCIDYQRASGAALVTAASAFLAFDPTQYVIGYMGKEPTRTDKTSNFQLENSIGCGGSASGTGAKATNNGTEWLGLETGTTNIGYAALYANIIATDTNNNVVQFDSSKPAKYTIWAEPVVALSDGTNAYVAEFGFGYSGGVSIIDGGGSVDGGNAFRYIHDEAGGDWQCVTHDGTTSTITDTGIPYALGQSYLLEISINAGFTSVEFKINGSVVATHTTNIYTGQTGIISPLAQIIKQAGTTNRAVYLANYSYQIGVKRIT